MGVWIVSHLKFQAPTSVSK